MEEEEEGGLQETYVCVFAEVWCQKGTLMSAFDLSCV